MNAAAPVTSSLNQQAHAPQSQSSWSSAPGATHKAQGSTPCSSKAGFTKLANGGYKPDVTARELVSGSIETIPQNRLEDLRGHLRLLLEAESERPPTPITASYEPISAEAEAWNSTSDEDKRGKKRPAKAMLLSSAWRDGATAAADLQAKRKLEKAQVGEKTELYLRQLSYSQDSIKGQFQDGRTVSQLRKELQSGEKKIEDVPTIMALVHQGQVFSVDNRRLWSFKNAGLHPDAKIPVISARTNQSFYTKFTTPTSGRTVRRRTEQGFH
jgi:hypothetical protein